MLRIAHDREQSTEFTPKYFVYDDETNGAVIYEGNYSQCLVIVGAVSLDPGITLQEINEKCNGFLFDSTPKLFNPKKFRDGYINPVD